MSKSYYIIPIFVPQEGCPHKCVFCNQDRITGLDEQVTKETVRSTIEDYIKTIDKKDATLEVSFFGGTFTGIEEKKQREFLQIAKEYKDKKIIDKIRLSTRPDYINEHILDYLKEYTVDIVELGVQSLDEEVLKKAGRGHNVKDVEMASALIKKYNITLGHQIMPGLPGDTFDKDIETVKKSISMKPDICRIYPSLVIKDTPMEIMYNRKDYIPYTLDEAVYISRIMYEMYISNNINVIRIGLQPTDAIAEGKDVIAGPFHPSMRELVVGSLISSKIIENFKGLKEITIFINPKDVSKLYANKKIYFNTIKKYIKNINVIQDKKVLKNSIVVKEDEKEIEIIF